jgi:hypothetical protein
LRPRSGIGPTSLSRDDRTVEEKCLPPPAIGPARAELHT